MIGRDDERGAVGTGWCVAWCEDDEAGDVVVAVLDATAQDGQVMEGSSRLASDGGFVRVAGCFDIGDRSRCVEKFILHRMRQLGGKKALALRKCDGVRIYLGNISQVSTRQCDEHLLNGKAHLTNDGQWACLEVVVWLVDRPVERVLHRHNDALGLASHVRMENIAKRRARYGIDLWPKPLLRCLLMKRPCLTLDGNMHEISIA